MADSAKKGITVKVDAQLHAQVSQYLKEHNMTMSEFVSLALDNELHPKNEMEDRKMEKMRTLAFQVPEDLFLRIKDYLQRNNMSQKDFVIGLIETELDRDLAQREGELAAQCAPAEQVEEPDGPEETADVSPVEAPGEEEEMEAAYGDDLPEDVHEGQEDSLDFSMEM